MDNQNREIPTQELVRALRTLPRVNTPPGLEQRIMRSIPHRRGLLGQLEFALKRSISSSCRSGSKILLPSSPFEYGVATAITGFFLLILTIIFVVTIHRTGLEDAFFNAFSALAPALLGATLLAMAGWVQIKSTKRIVRQHIRLAVVCFLFGICAAMGYFAGGQYLVNMTAGLLGLSGLFATLGLVLGDNLRRFTGEKDQNPFGSG